MGLKRSCTSIFSFSGDRLEQLSKLLSKPSAREEESRLLQECHVLLREAEENGSEGMCGEALSLGEALAGQIRSEEDFPPDYLANVEDKVAGLRAGLSAAEGAARALGDRAEFVRGRGELRARAEGLLDELAGLEEWLLRRKEEGADPLGLLGEEGLERLAGELRERRASSLSAGGSELPAVRRRAAEVAALPGAAAEPGNSVKEDAYGLCERWAAAEAALDEREREVAARLKAVREEKRSKASSAMSDREKELVRRLEATPLVTVSTEEGTRAELASLRSYLPWMDIGPDVKARLEERVAAVEADAERARSFKQELDGLFVWMREVDVFLNAEEAAFGDRETLEAQLKESNALQVRPTSLLIDM